MQIDFKLPALSVNQPWAWCIVNGYKPIENRSRRTNHRGPFLVHAGKRFDFEGERWIRENLPEIPLPGKSGCWRASDWQLGGIVGIAEIVACVEPNHAALLTSKDVAWYNRGSYAWIISEAKTLPFIACRGMLGFFKPKLGV